MSAESVQPARPDRTADVVVTVIELVVLSLLALVGSAGGVMLVMASDSCGTGPDQCRTGLLLIGVGMAVVAPWVAVGGTGVWAVVRMVRKQSAWWVPVLSVPIYAALAALSLVVVSASVS